MKRIVNILSHLLAIGAAGAISIYAQTFTTIHSFHGSDGELPDAGLVQGLDGNLYGTTTGGGVNGAGGTVYNISTRGSLTTLYSFCSQPKCTDGEQPYAEVLTQTPDFDTFGSTYRGGAYDFGEIFLFGRGGKPMAVYNFCPLAGCADGAFPEGTTVQSHGYLYGTTSGSGANGPNGTVFRLAPDGTLTTLYSFCSQPNCVDGTLPSAGVVQGFDGNFYGTTQTGGSGCREPGCGTVFKITPGGVLTTLHSFCSQSHCADGAIPVGGLVQGNDGDLYGTTQDGGSNGLGTVFRISPGGTLTRLYSFCAEANCADGSYPNAGLVQGSDGNFYGITTFGGSCAGTESGCGTIFKITPSGTLTTLHTFCAETNCTDGETPDAALVQDTNGTFYGTTNFGGANLGCSEGSCGTIYNLSVGLAPFVKTMPSEGKVGSTVEILGTNMTYPTSVTFNGTPAVVATVTFTVITAIVPAGATTGEVVVTLPGSTLSSNRPFQVLP